MPLQHAHARPLHHPTQLSKSEWSSLFELMPSSLNVISTRSIARQGIELLSNAANTRRFNTRIQAAVERLGDEALHDFWTASTRAARGTTPRLSGPEHTSWRRQWQLGDRRRLSPSGVRRRRRRRWPEL